MNTNSETKSFTVNAPAPFTGTEEERQANYASHYFDWEFQRCMDCDCRPWGEVANYPCGAEVPRVEYKGEEGERYMKAWTGSSLAHLEVSRRLAELEAQERAEGLY